MVLAFMGIHTEEESSGGFLADGSAGNVTMIPKFGGGMWDFEAVE